MQSVEMSPSAKAPVPWYRQGSITPLKRAKDGYELVEMEELVRYDRGCWLRFMKVPPSSNDADAGAKKAPAKGAKGAPTDDLKPVFGRAWVSFADLLKPGSTETKQRVQL